MHTATEHAARSSVLVHASSCAFSTAFSFSSASLFIDRLVDLIPAKYMDDSAGHEDVRYLKKAERVTKKEEFKRQFKADKRQRLDPEKATEQRKSTPAVAPPAAPLSVADAPQPKSGGNDVLRLKLQKRLEEMRKQRKADEQKEKVKSVKDWKEDAMGVGRKKAAAQQRQAQRQKTSKAGKLRLDDGPNAKSNETSNARSGSGSKAEHQRKNRGIEGQTGAGKKGAKGDRGDRGDRGDQSNDFSFGKLEFGGGDGPQHGKKKKVKPSKQSLLEQVEKDQGRVLTKAEEKAKAWKAALARAHGEKILDDPKLLRKSIKKDAKSAEKKQKAWADRMEKVKEQKDQKQQKRKANLQSRIDAKRDKKIQRREKKLAGAGNRAGFEGRKSTPIKKG